MTNIPKAKNNIDSLSFHVQRRKYVRKAYPLLDESNAIDLWYGPKALYGRINHRNEPQMISETNLKNFPSAPDLLAADFVVDAFQDLRSFMIGAARKRKIDVTNNSFMKLFRPSLAWTSAREEFDLNIREVYAAYVGTYLDTIGNHDQVKNFSSFVRHFLDFCKTSCRTVPVTLAGLVTSRYISPRISGLIVELSSEKYDDDIVKFKKFLTNPNFDFYQNAARKYGFRVDYNAPWRLVADISSGEMKKYMQKYSINSTVQLFDVYYYDAYKLDPRMIKFYMVQLYNDYVDGNPICKIVVPGSNKRPQVKSRVIRRRSVKEEALDSEFDNFFWLRFYFLLRSSELKINWHAAAQDKKLLDAKNVLNALDFSAALRYINNELFKNARS